VARLGIRGTVVEDRQPLTQTAGHLVFYLWLAWGQKPRWPAYIAEPPVRRCVHETWINQPQDLGYYFGSASCRTAKTIQAKGLGKRACGLQEHELKQEREASSPRQPRQPHRLRSDRNPDPGPHPQRRCAASSAAR